MTISRWKGKQSYRMIRVAGNDPRELAQALADITEAFEKWHGEDSEGVDFIWSVEGDAVVIRFDADAEAVGGW